MTQLTPQLSPLGSRPLAWILTAPPSGDKINIWIKKLEREQNKYIVSRLDFLRQLVRVQVDVKTSTFPLFSARAGGHCLLQQSALIQHLWQVVSKDPWARSNQHTNNVHITIVPILLYRPTVQLSGWTADI